MFANMEPGEYHLRVKGSNHDGIWNEKGTSIRLIITPPFWKAWWFRILLILFILTFFYKFYRNRLNREIKKIKTENAMAHFFNKFNITDREQEVLKLLLMGKSNKVIEDKLFISAHTVRNHIYNIYQKLNISSRVQLIKLFQDTYLGDSK